MADFKSLKQAALKKYFGKMNEPQQKAVFTVNGSVLILAGAGSGKTTVLVNRIANMLFFGNAYNSTNSNSNNCSEENLNFLADFAAGKTHDVDTLKEIVADSLHINPWNILAITFTNKAAGELKQRLENMLGDMSKDVVAATFHSACVRILRREIEVLGYNRNFTIYDSDDSSRVIKSCLSDLNIAEKQFPPKSVMTIISGAKDQLITPQDFQNEEHGDYRKMVIARVYELYQTKLLTANALDFDDIIRLTVKLFSEHSDVLEHYQNRFKYIMVDEYQDTNMAQYRLVTMLSAKHKNLCVVGDDDQSIYKFRGATIANILGFEEQFTDCTTIRLEQNYRSTGNILSVANSIIQNNKSRKVKKLWTAHENGSKTTVYKASDEQGESKFVADTILNNVKAGMKYNDHAVLYRMNAQSNSLERTFIQSGIAYRVIGGLRFYDRKEIKDIVAYLNVINNNNDLLRLKRIINEPKRKIGEATVTVIEQISVDLKISPIQVLRDSAKYAPLAKKSAPLVALAKIFDKLTEKSAAMPLDEFLNTMLDATGYLTYMKSLGDEGLTRIENINELKSNMVSYKLQAEEPSLGGFLEEISLYTDVDKLDENTDTVTMMTIHSAKGLEFNQVFVVGMEEGIFPGMRSIENEADLEEERRLAYVAVTRARNQLYLSHASQRMLFGSTGRNLPSRFIREIDTDFVNRIDPSTKATKASSGQPENTSARTNTLQMQIARSKVGEKSAVLDFVIDERVSHNVFGDGVIVSVKKMSNDTMLEVEFDKVGKKKLMANFAKITKLSS